MGTTTVKQAPSDTPPASEPANPDDSNSAEPAPGGDVQTNEDGMTYVNVTGDIDLSGVDLSGKTFGYVTINSSAPWGGRVGTEFARLARGGRRYGPVPGRQHQPR